MLLPLQMITLAVVRKPADRPAVAASLNKDLAMIQEWFIHWCMILNQNPTEALVVSWSRTVNLLQVDLVFSGVSIHACPNIDIICMKFDSKLTFEDYVLGQCFSNVFGLPLSAKKNLSSPPLPRKKNLFLPSSHISL